MAIWVWVLAAAIDGFLAVAAGAVGSHALAGDPPRAALMGTGAQYAMVHALAVLALAALAGSQAAKRRSLVVVVWCFIAGSVLFSGSLYLLALGGPHGLVWVTPVGGIAFLIGWIALAVHAVTAIRR